MPWHKRKGPERGAYGGEKTAGDEKEETKAQERIKALRWHKKESDDNKQGGEKNPPDKHGWEKEYDTTEEGSTDKG